MIVVKRYVERVQVKANQKIGLESDYNTLEPNKGDDDFVQSYRQLTFFVDSRALFNDDVMLRLLIM